MRPLSARQLARSSPSVARVAPHWRSGEPFRSRAGGTRPIRRVRKPRPPRPARWPVRRLLGRPRRSAAPAATGHAPDAPGPNPSKAWPRLPAAPPWRCRTVRRPGLPLRPTPRQPDLDHRRGERDEPGPTGPFVSGRPARRRRPDGSSSSGAGTRSPRWLRGPARG